MIISSLLRPTTGHATGDRPARRALLGGSAQRCTGATPQQSYRTFVLHETGDARRVGEAVGCRGISRMRRSLVLLTATSQYTLTS
jgi:hypothetical protein